MKNYQQTPKQRRQKLEKDKRQLRHSTPLFQHAGNWWGTNDSKRPSPWCKR